MNLHDECERFPGAISERVAAVGYFSKFEGGTTLRQRGDLERMAYSGWIIQSSLLFYNYCLGFQEISHLDG